MASHDFSKDDTCCGFCGHSEIELGADVTLVRGQPLSHTVLNSYYSTNLENFLRRSPGLTNGKNYHPNACVHICSNCVFEHADMLTALAMSREEPDKGTSLVPSGPRRMAHSTPEDVKKFLDLHIIGQENAKRAISVAVWQHLRSIAVAQAMAGRRIDDAPSVVIDKSNVLLIGPTGVGKTLLAEKIAEYLDAPFAKIDATTITEAGYVGKDADYCLIRLIEAAKGDVKKAERGIVYIDEVDKINKKQTSGTSDVHGEGAQQAFLKMLEGSIASVQLKKDAPFVTIDTRHILFIASGAFPGLKKIIEKRMNKGAGIGFGSDVKRDVTESECLANVDTEDLVNFGMIEEFIGRFPALVALEPLTADDIRRILTEPANAIIPQYQLMFKAPPLNIVLDFSEEVLLQVAVESLGRNTGARGLRRVLITKLRDLFFILPGRKRRNPNLSRVVVTLETLEGGDAEWEYDAGQQRQTAAVLAPPRNNR